MPGPQTNYEKLAKAAADRIDRARELGEQLTFLPDEQPQGQVPAKTRGKDKALSQMREFLTAKGYRFPEEMLAEMAGLASGVDAMTAAMVGAERVLNWAGEGATARVFMGVQAGWVEQKDGEGNPLPWQPSPEDKLEVFKQLYTVQLRANEALLPYGAPKATPDQGPGPLVQINMPGAPMDRGQAARDVTPGSSGPSTPRAVPRDVLMKNQQKQDVTEIDVEAADGKGRTE